MDPWPAVVVVGFALVTALVIVLARGSTARWERQRAALRRRRSLRRERRSRGRLSRGPVAGEPQRDPVPRRRRNRSEPIPRPRPAHRHQKRRSGKPRVSGGS